MASSESKTVILAALIGNGLIAITKFIAASITGSAAMVSEGIHSVVDTGNQVLLLYGLKASARPADERFPFGHGKEIYFWSFVVAILIFAVGAGVATYEGIHHILHPTPTESPEVAYIVLGLAVIFEGFAWAFAFKAFRKAKGQWGYFEAVQRGKDPSLFVVLFEDSAAMLGLLIAAGGIALGQFTGNPVWDGVASVMIGLILGGTAVWLAIETKGLLIGEAANTTVIDGIKAMAGEHPAVETVNECLTLHMGPQFILLTLSVEFHDDLDTGRIEQTIKALDTQIKAKYPRVQRVFIEAEAPSLLTPSPQN